MYKSIKRIIQFSVPKQLLQQHEFFLRRLISLRYKGNNHQCTICNFKLHHFVELEDKDLLCPRCGSRSRTRRLYKLLNETHALKGTVLHFSPPRSLYENFKKRTDLNYFSSDFENEFTADYKYDITEIATASRFFDLIICYHVLEHIEDDKKAMEELYRVLKTSGVCFIQTPYKTGDLYEDFNITRPDERKTAFGQEDHVRIYTVDSLKKRLESAGLETESLVYEGDFYNGLQNETVIVAKKVK